MQKVIFTHCVIGLSRRQSVSTNQGNRLFSYRDLGLYRFNFPKITVIVIKCIHARLKRTF